MQINLWIEKAERHVLNNSFIVSLTLQQSKDIIFFEVQNLQNSLKKCRKAKGGRPRTDKYLTIMAIKLKNFKLLKEHQPSSPTICITPESENIIYFQHYFSTKRFGRSTWSYSWLVNTIV